MTPFAPSHIAVLPSIHRQSGGAGLDDLVTLGGPCSFLSPCHARCGLRLPEGCATLSKLREAEGTRTLLIRFPKLTGGFLPCPPPAHQGSPLVDSTRPLRGAHIHTSTAFFSAFLPSPAQATLALGTET